MCQRARTHKMTTLKDASFTWFTRAPNVQTKLCRPRRWPFICNRRHSHGAGPVVRCTPRRRRERSLTLGERAIFAARIQNTKFIAKIIFEVDQIVSGLRFVYLGRNISDEGGGGKNHEYHKLNRISGGQCSSREEGDFEAAAKRYKLSCMQNCTFGRIECAGQA